MPGLGRKLCPSCHSRDLIEIREYAWSDASGEGRCKELRCNACGAALVRELGGYNMTSEQYQAWRTKRVLARARVVRR